MDRAVRIYCCYDAADLVEYRALSEQMVALLQRGEIAVFEKGMLEAGEKVKERLQQESEQADALLALLSPSFIASSDCWSAVEEALRRRQHIVPVLVRPLHPIYAL
jgi:hypothetical protein